MPNITTYSEYTQFELHSPWMPSPIVLGVVLLALGTLYTYFFPSQSEARKIHQLGGISIINAWTFFTKRYDFLRSNFNKTGHALFSFKVLQVSVNFFSD
jgi:sterol 14-demethylase